MNTRISTLRFFLILLPVTLTSTAQAAPIAGWGSNNFGQLNFPAGTFTAMAAGSHHSLAIRRDGTLVGFGYNDHGQTNVPAGTFTAVAASFFHSLGIRTDGTLAGWGNNSEGEINVPSGTFTAIAAGWYHSLAIRSDGSLAAWGNNDAGQLSVPPGTFIAISANYYQSLAIRSDGTLVAWGCGLENFGQCDVRTGTFTAVAAGTYHSLAIRSDGTLAGWGRNNQGQINVPPGTFVSIAAGGSHSLAIRSDGTLTGWGNNAAGQTDVPSGVFTALAAGGSHGLALYSDAIPTVSEWGLIGLTVLVLCAGTIVLARRGTALGRSVQRSTLPVVAILAVVGMSSSVVAQPAPVPSQKVVLRVDSGLVSATEGIDPVVVFSHMVHVGNAPWIRLHFEEVQLSGSPSARNKSFLRITSEGDGDMQVLDSSALALWKNTSAYFNGEAVLIELLAHTGTGANRLVIEYAVAGIPSEQEASSYICGPTDDRVPSSDPRAARIMPVLCTGFLFNERSNCLLTAGHCVADMLAVNNTVVQFNVPLSNCDGTINNPPAQYQYPFDVDSIQFFDIPGTEGHDWCQFGVFNNTTTLISPLKAQGASYKLANIVPPADGSTLQVTGYGVDYELPGTCWPYAYNEYNKTQQTHTGPYQQNIGTAIRYVIDVQPGTSGAAVEHLSSGLVYGIVSDGFCGSGGEYNSATAIDLPGLQSAIACPIGVCADCNGNGILDQCDLNCASPCGGCNVSGCGGSMDCNSNGVPDECDITHGKDSDCNNNDLPDSCDIAGQTSDDCDENGVPDGCQPLTMEPAACCHSGDQCSILTECRCDELSGVYVAFQTSCSTSPCAMFGP